MIDAASSHRMAQLSTDGVYYEVAPNRHGEWSGTYGISVNTREKDPEQ